MEVDLVYKHCNHSANTSQIISHLSFMLLAVKRIILLNIYIISKHPHYMHRKVMILENKVINNRFINFKKAHNLHTRNSKFSPKLWILLPLLFQLSTICIYKFLHQNLFFLLFFNLPLLADKINVFLLPAFSYKTTSIFLKNPFL